MKKLIVISGTCVVVFVAWALMFVSLEPDETQSQPEVSIIKMLPADYNPYQKLYDEMLYPTVRISSSSGIGSGVVISATDDTDYILTAGHVVGNNSSVTVTFYSYHRGAEVAEEIQGSVLITDTNKDLALLATDTHGLTRTYSAKLTSKDYKPFLFTPVWTVGCSLGLSPRPSEGIITSISVNQCSSVANFWEVSSPILPGNSGGPVYDAKTHEVIGIAVWVHTYKGQLVTTMAGVVPIQTIYEFLSNVDITAETQSSQREEE